MMNNRLFEILEQRRLLSLAILGPATDVPGESGSSFDLAVAGNGSFIIARIPGDMFATRSVEVLRSSAAGQQIGSTITIASGDSVDAISVSMDSLGDAVIAYTNGGVNVERISKSGVASSPVLIDANGYDPAVSMDSAGGYFLGWTTLDHATFQRNERVQAFNANGVSRAAAFTVTSLESLETMDDTHIDAKPDGSGAVVAMEQTFEGAQDNVAFARISTTAVLGSATDIADYPLNEDNPNVAINADGTFEVGYTTYDNISGPGSEAVTLSILTQRFDANGTAQGNPIVLWSADQDADVPKDMFHTPSGFVSLDTIAGGGFVATYARSIDNNLGDPTTSPTFVQQFNAQGVADSDGPIPVATNSFPAQIGVDDDGNAVVAYRPLDDGAPLRFVPVSLTTDFATIQNDQLAITGTAGDDSISIAVDGSNLIVTRGTETRTFSAAEVGSIRVDGFDGNDTITNGTLLPSTLEGGDGDDTIFGGDGADRIDGGAGSDSLWGGDSNDRLAGDDGHDYLYGNGGNDSIYGGLQPDFIRGNGGRDRLYGNGGNDIIYGGASSDSLYGQGGNDQLNGEGGNDRLYADYDSGSSTLHGGAGNDTLITKNSLVDNLFGDGGHDSATADDNDVLTSIEAAA